MSTEAETPSLRLLQKLGKLTEIARVFDVNRADGNFGDDEGGQIYYVFDTNIFQMFLKPFTFSRYTELFQSPLWTRGRNDFEVNSESALISSEYLFGGRLPFQAGEQVFVSTWHHDELLEQVARLYAEVRETVETPGFAENVKAGVQYLDSLCELLLSHDEKAYADLREKVGESAERDDQRLVELNVPLKRRMEIFAVRTICQFLATDRYTEPMEQLRRLPSEIVSFSPHTDRPEFAISPNHNKEYQQTKGRWSKRLKAADQAVGERLDRRLERSPSARKSTGGLRSATSIRHDASTLAWLDIVAKHVLTSKERIVFVTGDRVVLNACRRRNADHPGQPFFVRSVQHFAPLFNLSDASSDLTAIGEPKQHFAKMRQAIGQSLALLNLSLEEKDKLGRLQPHVVTGRDNFLVDVEEKDGDILKEHHEGLFELFFDKRWVAEKESELDAIARPFQDMERLAISSFSDKIIARVESGTALKRLREWKKSPGKEDLGTAIESAMKALLDDVGKATMDFAIKSAPQFIATLTKAPSRLFERAVYRVRLELPVGKGAVSPVEQYVKSLIGRAPRAVQAQLELLRDQPALLFSLAVILAFQSERWALAANMADLAAEAARQHDNGLHGEIEYIRSVALRYRLSSVRPNLEEASEDIWSRWRLAAESAQRHALINFSEEENPVRHMRSLSERAAVRLAYLEWVAYGRLDQLREHRLHRTEFRQCIIEQFASIREDLEHCQAISEWLACSADSGNGLDTRSEHARAIGHHWRWNMVVADITARKLSALGLFSAESHKPLASAAILDGLPPQGDEHLVYEIYRLQLTGGRNVAAVRQMERRMTDELSLALDLAVAQDLLAAMG